MGKRTILPAVAGFSLALAAGPALADGMPSLKDTMVAPEVPTWSGAYFGGSLGYGHDWSKNKYRELTGDRDRSDRDEDADGGLVSLVMGYDCQWDRIVAGVFADVDWSDINRGHDFDGLTIDRSFAIGGRLGVLVRPNTLLFATAGYTRAHFDNDHWWDIPDTSAGGAILPGRGSANFDGYFIGAGLEQRLTTNFYLRGEVRYADYGSEISNSGVAGDGTVYVDREDPEVVTGRLGIVYKLGRGEPFRGSDEGGDRPLKVISYYGVDVAKDIWTVYSGGLFALNGDFTRNGVVARTFGWYSDYDYRVPGIGTVDAKDRAMDAMLGYLYYFGSLSAIGYVGMEVRDVDLSPDDPINEVRGTETGFKVALELESGDEDPYYFSFDTSYSTAFDTYYGNLRVGLNRGGTKFGPEGEIWDEDGDTTSRLGAFVILPFNVTPTLPSEVSLAGGYQWVDEDKADGRTSGSHGGEGGYFNAMWKVLF